MLSKPLDPIKHIIKNLQNLIFILFAKKWNGIRNI